MRDRNLVFCNDAEDFMDGSALRRRFYAARERAGLQRIRFHDLRHFFGTLAVQDFPLTDIRAYMGHADVSTMMIYVHHVPRHDAAEKLSALLAEAIAPGALPSEAAPRACIPDWNTGLGDMATASRSSSRQFLTQGGTATAPSGVVSRIQARAKAEQITCADRGGRTRALGTC